MAKKLLIVGAGIAGLSAGVHACRNGYEVEIFEKHNLPGGLCTAWERNGYTFDGCINFLFGTKKDSQFNCLWREVGALEKAATVNHDIFLTVEGSQGKKINIYSDIERLEKHLIEISAQDGAVIKTIAEAVRAISRTVFPLHKPEELYKLYDLPLMLLKMMPALKVMGQYSRVTIGDYLKQINDPFLREALSLIATENYSMVHLISTLASLNNRDAGYPLGGSLEFACSIESCFRQSGGKINYQSPVKEIVVEKKRATGLLLENGEKVQGDLVISAADLYHTAYELLKGKYLTEIIKESFVNLPTYTSAQVSLGVAADLSGEAENIALKLDNPIKLGNEENRYLHLTNFSFDPTLAPSGKTAIRATLFSSYEYWEGAAKNRELYRERKEQLARVVINETEKRFPAIKGKIEVHDVATPVTYNRYTGVYRGAYMGWVVPPDSGKFKIPKELPGLDNFYQIGQWIAPPAGLPGSMLTGRHLVQIICRRDKKAFKTAN